MQTTHSFSLGDRVNLAKVPPKTSRGPYIITALMPEGPDGEPQYGIKAEGEGPERVVTESEILDVAPASPEEIRAQRAALQAERQAEARTAWNDYLEEREAIARRTAELRELRLKAEAAAAAKIAALAKSAQAAKAKAPKPAAGKAAAPAPAAKQAAAKAAEKPAARAKAPAGAAKTAVRATAAAKAPAKAPAKTAARKPAAAKAARPKTGTKVAAKPASRGKTVKSPARKAAAPAKRRRA